MKHTGLILIVAICLPGCTAAFEIGEALNRATSNISSDPARYLWSKSDDAESLAPASAPVATIEQVSTPSE